MKSIKVFVETSTLISASIYATSKDLDVELVHRFYEISVPLFHLFKKYIHQRIGMTTATVEDEARTSLSKAVIDTLKEKAEKEPERRDELFQAYAIFLGFCSDNLRNNLAILLREPLLEEEVNGVLPEVSKMYYELESMGEIPDIREVAKVKARYVPKRFRKTAEHIYRNQLYEDARHLEPLKRLRGKPVGERDKKILAEAVCVFQRYKKYQPTMMFFASTDHHFSPLRGIRTLTDEIEKRFGIICDWPNEILKKIKPYIKKSA